MKAAVLSRYGPPEVIRVQEVEKPVPADNQVLIQVRAASVNPLDKHNMRGTPRIARLAGGLREPTERRLGVDVAGRVEAVGKSVGRLKPGDEVFGTCRGSFGEFVCAPESTLGVKPANVGFEQAATAPVAGLTALQSLRDKGHIQAGQKVLINGAAGGVGTYTVQIAKWFGADVTGVCSTRNVSMVKALGADRAIDYTQEDFTAGGQRYDMMVDCVGNRSLSACRRVLTPAGVCAVVTGPNGPLLGPLARMLQGLMFSWFIGQKFTPFIAKPNVQDLEILGELMKAGKVTPVIDRSYPLSEVAEAIRYVEGGHARGKVVVVVT